MSGNVCPTSGKCMNQTNGKNQCMELLQAVCGAHGWGRATSHPELPVGRGGVRGGKAGRTRMQPVQYVCVWGQRARVCVGMCTKGEGVGNVWNPNVWGGNVWGMNHKPSPPNCNCNTVVNEEPTNVHMKNKFVKVQRVCGV